MNIILNKIAFKEWQKRMQIMHNQLNKEYNIITKAMYDNTNLVSYHSMRYGTKIIEYEIQYLVCKKSCRKCGRFYEVMFNNRPLYISNGNNMKICKNH